MNIQPTSPDDEQLDLLLDFCHAQVAGPLRPTFLLLVAGELHAFPNCSHGDLQKVLHSVVSRLRQFNAKGHKGSDQPQPLERRA